MLLNPLNQAFKVLQKGSGNNATLVKQISKLSSFAQNPDQMLGTFNNWKETSVALSTAAEVDADQSEVFTRNAIKAIRPGEKDKAQELMKKSGVTPQTKFFDAYKQIAPVVLAEAKEKKKDIGQILKDYGYDEREQIAMGAFINKGVMGGVIADRQKEADANADPAVAKRIVADAHRNVEGPIVHTKAVEATKVAGFERGAEKSLDATLREQAEERLVKRGENTQSWTDKAFNYTFGALEQAQGGLPGQEQRRTDEMRKILEERAAKQGVKLPGGETTEDTLGGYIPGTAGISTPDARSAFMRRQMDAFKAQGGNPLVDIPRGEVERNRAAAQAGGGPQAMRDPDALKQLQLARNIIGNNVPPPDALKAQGGGPQAMSDPAMLKLLQEQVDLLKKMVPTPQQPSPMMVNAGGSGGMARMA
jgi:hypothetical protein